MKNVARPPKTHNDSFVLFRIPLLKRIPDKNKKGDSVLLRRGTENNYETPYSF